MITEGKLKLSREKQVITINHHIPPVMYFGTDHYFSTGGGGSHFGKPAHNFFSHSAASNNFFLSFYSCEQFF